MEQPLCDAQSAVQQLCEFNSRYFVTHGEECASKKVADVTQKTHETLALLDQLQGSLPRQKFLYLRGKALNVLPEHSPEAEQCLSRAVKQDPTLVDAWNCLGECYWKAGNVTQAYNCFKGALGQERNKESLRNLSVVLRQMGKDQAEQEAYVKESISKAKEAVAIDVTDGKSWTILGNAYMSMFFAHDQDAELLKRSQSAYSQAEKDKEAVEDPDLHFNRGTLHLYMENYGDAVIALTMAARLDPSWALVQQKLESTRQFLRNMNEAIVTKGKLKAKRLSAITSDLLAREKAFADAEGKEPTLVSGLKEGSNDSAVFIGAIVATYSTMDYIPLGCVLIDSTSECISLTVYNLARTTQFGIGDVLTIPCPDLRCIAVLQEEVAFKSIRITKPLKMLVNGHQLDKDKVASSVVRITAFS